MPGLADLAGLAYSQSYLIFRSKGYIIYHTFLGKTKFS
jgi:hypothetical protein